MESEIDHATALESLINGDILLWTSKVLFLFLSNIDSSSYHRTSNMAVLIPSNALERALNSNMTGLEVQEHRNFNERFLTVDQKSVFSIQER